MNMSHYDSNISRSAFADTDFGMIFRTVLVGGVFVVLGVLAYSFAGNASTEKQSNAVQAESVPSNTIENDIVYLKSQVSKLRADNQSLRAEINTLTAKNGVVETIISHLRELKAKDQAILSLLQPSENAYPQTAEDDPQYSEQPVMGNARHQIVTPRAKAPPIPTPKPVDVAEAKASDTDKEKGAASSQ